MSEKYKENETIDNDVKSYPNFGNNDLQRMNPEMFNDLNNNNATFNNLFPTEVVSEQVVEQAFNTSSPSTNDDDNDNSSSNRRFYFQSNSQANSSNNIIENTIPSNDNNKDILVNKNELLNKKRKNNNIGKKEKIFFTIKLPKGQKLDGKDLKKYRKKWIRAGRKKKTDKKERSHNKFSSDNIINKLRVYFFHFVRDVIKKNSINEIIYFKKAGNDIIANLTKDKNDKMHKMKIKDILSEQEISSKYKTYNKFENKIIIEKIYKEQKQIKVIKILDLTFEELFIIFRKNLKNDKDKEKIVKIAKKIEDLDLLKEDNKYEDINYMVGILRKKYENLAKKELDNYIEKVEKLCCDYENWFNNKLIKIAKK